MTQPRAHRVAVDLTPMQVGGVNGGAKPAALALVTLLAESGRFHVTVLLRASYGEELPFAGREGIDIVPVDERFLGSAQWIFGGAEPWSLARALGCDLLFAPFGDPLLAERGLPAITQRYDLQHLDHPEFFAREELRHRAASDKRLKDASAHVITCSDHARRTFVEKLGVADRDITVIPLPAPVLPEPLAPSARSQALDRLGLGERPYLYYPANFWPHKNHERLLEAFARAVGHGQKPIDLVLTGDPLDQEARLRELARELGIDERVRILGFVSDEDRHAIWSGCTALVFPSLYEGFGIPLQEALLYDKPIAASSACSIPEVGGDAAMYFDGRDVDAIAAALAGLIEGDPGGGGSASARAAQLARFEPDEILQRYADLFEAVLGESPSHTAAVAPPVDVVVTGCEDRLGLERTLAGLETQTVTPRTIVIGASGPPPPDLLRQAERFRQTHVASGMDDVAQGESIRAALVTETGGLVLFLRAGDVLLEGALARAISAHAAFPRAAVIHGPSIPLAGDGSVLLAPHPEPVSASDATTRRFAERASTFVVKDALPNAWVLPSARFAFEATVAQIPDDAGFLYIPVPAAQTPAEQTASPNDLRALAMTLTQAGVDDPGPWLLDLCAEIVRERHRKTRGGLSDFQVADHLLWTAPLLFGQAGIPFDDTTQRALAERWRNARAGPRSSLLLNPIQEILRTNPRDTVLRGLVGPPLAERSERTFGGDSDSSGPASAHAFRSALGEATAADLHPALQEILARPDTRDFVVSAFEYAAERTPCAAEVALFAGADGAEERLAALKDIVSAAIARDWEQVEKAALERTPFHAAQGPEAVYPLGSTVPTTADEWFGRLTLIEQHPAGEDRPQRTRALAKTQERAEGPPSVSILCSLYDGDDYIDAYLENLTAQEDFGEFELIIVDAASPGSERAVIEAYQERFSNIAYSRTDHRIGIYEAWNIAVVASSGRYLTNANLDDSRHPASIARMRDALDHWPEVDVVYSDAYYTFIPHLDWASISAVGLRSDLPPATRHNMFDFNSPHCAPMWRRSLHDRIGFFDESYRSAGDWEFWLRAMRSGIAMRKLDEPLVAYFHNPRGVSTRIGSPSDREEAAIRRAYRDLLIGPDAPLDPARSGASIT